MCRGGYSRHEVRSTETGLIHTPPGAGREEYVNNAMRTIKWRAAAPLVRAGAVAGTVVALIAVVGAPYKWW